MLVSLELLPTSQKNTKVLDFSIVTSAYGHSKIQRYLKENSILYINPNKKRTDNWLSLNGLQLPVGENQRGSIRKITYSNGKVKIQNPIHMTQMQEKLYIPLLFSVTIFNQENISAYEANENHEEIEIKKKMSRKEAPVENSPSHLNDSSSKDRIPQSFGKSNTPGEKESVDDTISDDREYMAAVERGDMKTAYSKRVKSG